MSRAKRSLLARPIVALLAAAFAFAGARVSDGAVVFLVGEAEPIYGYLISANAATVVLEVPRADGTREEKVFARDRVQDLLVTVSPERLESLAPPDPLPYLQYAEELAVKKQDPEARDAARRLFLVAGNLSPEAHGRQALLGLATVAVDAAEAGRARTLAALIDPTAAAIEAPSSSGGTTAKVDAGLARILLAGIVAYRRGEVSKAKLAFLGRDLEGAVEGAIPPETVERLTESLNETDFRPDREVLAALVPLELALRTSGTVSLGGSGKSSDPFAREALVPVSWPTWRNLTPFDPDETIFRAGAWRKP